MGIGFWEVETVVATQPAPTEWPAIQPAARALMIYTSGTTGKPKGAVHTHGSLAAQIQTLVTAWQWQATDKTLLTLPLHHIHGLVNILGCGLWAGATVVILPKFDAGKVWEIFAQSDFTVFMAVPTIYSLLVEAYRAASPAQQAGYTQACQAMRLMVSGSAALPVTLLNAWQEISGHFLLERYGMTEIGMAISNPMEGFRKAGSVGKPLPGVSIRLVDEAGQVIAQAHEAGEIQVKSPCMFLEYWRKPDITKASFSAEGWFKTGDIAEQDEEGYYKILGRNSTDIIKSGGYKLSALEIEGVFLQHPEVAACAVVGLPDERWGEVVAMAVVMQAAASSAAPDLLHWGKAYLASYKIPKQVIVVAELPKNAMGKVVKNEVKQWFAKE
jgi:malonyl-CoA/methylmalonyl-CoA synthetase